MKWFLLYLAHRYEAYPCPRSAKPAVILAHPRRQSLRPFFCRSKQDINRIARPASPVSRAGRYNTLHLASKVVCQRGGIGPLWKPPGFVGVLALKRILRPISSSLTKPIETVRASGPE